MKARKNMKISGFQKMTLLDYPGKVACTVWTLGCPFRCGFCHNASLVTHTQDALEITEEEVLSHLAKRKGLLEGICITGGEPLLHPDIEEFLVKIKALGYAIKLDTNGAYPKKLKELVGKGLVDYVAMDVKNSPEKYAETIGIEGFDISPVKESVEFLLSGGVDFEFRTTVVKEYHTVEDISAIALWIKGAERYYLQNFVDSGDLICSHLSAVSKEKMEEMQKAAHLVVPGTEIRGI